MNLLSLVLCAIFFAYFLLVAVPSAIACYRYWFRGVKLISERLDADFTSPLTTYAQRSGNTSKKDPSPSYIQAMSITDQSTHLLQSRDSIERRQ
jgi:hypothetical protein